MAGANNPPRRFQDLPPATQAGIICSDPRFGEFLRRTRAFPGEPANFIRGFCDIASRSELNTNPTARARFAQLQTAFDAWTGKIPSPR